ncbi:MAG: hypothetical protein INR73_25250 [Williamsia sp.]|nr:hypothetical protein [Williamsia sp.]
MQFKDIIAPKRVQQDLTELVQSNRLSHALLFLGREGSGALLAALAFSQYLVCERVSNSLKEDQTPSLFGENPQAADPKASSTAGVQETKKWTDACGECPACLKAQQFIHPDIHYSYPVVSKKGVDKPLSTDYIREWREFLVKEPYGNVYDWLQFIAAENKQGNITAHECNDILHKLSLKSFESDYKIHIMWMPEYLGNEGNKLLKLIEEPPANTIFIMVAENESLILPTILSRCQLVKIPPIPADAIEEALIREYKIPVQQAKQLAGMSEGNYHEALQLVQHAEEDWQHLLREWLNAILKTGPAAQVKWIEEISRIGREKQKQFLRYFNHLLAQCIRVQIIGEAALKNVADKEKDFMLRLNKLADIASQKVMVEELDKAVYYIERNANARLLFHALTIKLYHIMKDKALITCW